MDKESAPGKCCWRGLTVDTLLLDSYIALHLGQGQCIPVSSNILIDQLRRKCGCCKHKKISKCFSLYIFTLLKCLYRVLKINASREMERNWPTAALLAATDPAWLVFSFPPFSGRRFVWGPGNECLQVLSYVLPLPFLLYCVYYWEVPLPSQGVCHKF